MLLLQRGPIDVNTSLGCPRTGEHLYESTTRLLQASTGLRPYVGAVIRNAVKKPEIEKMLDPDQGETAQRIASFLRPVNKAMQDWWNKEPYGRQSRHPRNLQKALWSTITSDGGILHIDDPLEDGPLTALLTLKGSVLYGLSVWRRNVFREPVTNPYNVTLPSPKSVAEVTVTPGDLLIFTNVPPTFHQAESLEPRQSVLFRSGFDT